MSHDVAVGPAVSVFAGLVAASLPPAARVLCAQEDFASVLFPVLAHEQRGLDVELVPLARPRVSGAELLRRSWALPPIDFAAFRRDVDATVDPGW